MDISRIVVIDTGGTSAHALYGRIRKLKAFSVIREAQNLEPEAFSGNVKGIVIAGNAQALSINPACIKSAIDSGLPVLALGKNARFLLFALGGHAERLDFREGAMGTTFDSSPLFEGLSDADRYFERADAFTLPPSLTPIAFSKDGWISAFSDADKRIFGLQFGVESNDPDGMRMMKNFLSNVCGMNEEWTMPAYLDRITRTLSDSYPTGRVVAAVSGSVRSVVSAMIAIRAFQSRVTCVMLDTGLLKKGETERVKKLFEEEIGIPLITIDISNEVFDALKGAHAKGDKHERIRKKMLKALLNYGDIVVRGAGFGGSFEIAPTNLLLREEAREIAELIGLPESVMDTKPFPETGFANRIGGEVTREKAALISDADECFSSEIRDSSIDKKLFNYFVTLEPSEEGGFSLILHALMSREGLIGYAFRMPYDVIERTVIRILSSKSEITGVFYDVTGR